MSKALIVLLTLTLASCGGFKHFSNTKLDKKRSIASFSDEKQASEELDKQLKALHSYYIIAQKQLALFDGSINDTTLENLYQSRPYMALITIRSQVEEIEKEILITLENKATHNLLLERIHHFANQSVVSRLSLENIKEKLGVYDGLSIDVSENVINDEYEKLEKTKEFQIYEKNIDHLSHLMQVNIKSDSERFRPSVNTAGNITGEEFPAKVWALSFDNGPNTHTTEEILKKLNERNLKATFFQLSSKIAKDQAISSKVKNAGMEIGSNSNSLQDLAKVGSLTLEKEINEAILETQKKLKIDLKFFRLPFGSGVSVPNIRQMISKNDLIHVFWNVDSLDWMAQTPDRIVKRTKALMKKTSRDAGIILFHDSHPRSVKASAGIMDYLTQHGRRTCTLGKIVSDMNEGSETVCLKN